MTEHNRELIADTRFFINGGGITCKRSSGQEEFLFTKFILGIEALAE